MIGTIVHIQLKNGMRNYNEYAVAITSTSICIRHQLLTGDTDYGLYLELTQGLSAPAVQGLLEQELRQYEHVIERVGGSLYRLVEPEEIELRYTRSWADMFPRGGDEE